MNNEQVPEREIWIEPEQGRATRYWQPIVFQGGVRYILASTVAAQLAEKDAEIERLKEIDGYARQEHENQIRTITATFRGQIDELRANHQSQLEQVRRQTAWDAWTAAIGIVAPRITGAGFKNGVSGSTLINAMELARSAYREAAADQPMSKGDTDAK